jgi:hypothetical protein
MLDSAQGGKTEPLERTRTCAISNNAENALVAYQLFSATCRVRLLINEPLPVVGDTR